MNREARESAGLNAVPPVRRTWPALGVIGGLLGLIGLFAWGLTRDARFIPSPLVNQQAPALELTQFNGERFSLADHAGHVVVVNFWASWCTACELEAPVLEGGWLTFRDHGVVFLGVNIQDRREDALAFIREHGKTYPNGPDPDGKLTIDYGVYAVPETFFIDREGKIAHKHFGALTWAGLSTQITALL
ncbi:MAG: TlpA family protein disulfide reductase [Candidatus Tectimicrobiota bacterium]